MLKPGRDLRAKRGKMDAMDRTNKSMMCVILKSAPLIEELKQ